MGKIILVPPPMKIEVPAPQNGGQFSGMMKTYPVVLNMSPSYSDPNGNAAHTLNASVTIQDPRTDYKYYDPMLSQAAFYSLSGAAGGSKVSNRSLGGASPLIHRIDATLIPRMFWDHAELEDIVYERFRGNLLVQIDNNSSDYNAISSWNFCAADTRDNEALRELLARRKSNQLASHKGLRDEVSAWLRANATDYDLYEARFSDLYDDVYIRNSTEAIHFKMKWHKEEPEEIEEEVPF